MLPATKTTVDLQRRWRCPRWVVIGAMIIAAGGIAVFVTWQHERRVAWLAREIAAAAGSYTPRPTLIELCRQFLKGNLTLPEATVMLKDPALRPGWMHEHGHLHGLSLREINLRGTREFDAEDADLFALNPVASVHSPLARHVDRIATALTDCSTLISFDARGSDLSDEGLGLLPLEQLQNLQLQNSTVTAAGLRQLRRCHELEYLALDGSQLDAELISALQSLSHPIRLHLVGRKVTDEHLRLVPSLKVEKLSLERTSVTANGVKTFSSRQPDVSVGWDEE